jgi:SAM-dependent methyltransferase
MTPRILALSMRVLRKPATVRERRGRYRALAALGVVPPFKETFALAIAGALDAARPTASGPLTVLDAGCGHRSPLSAERDRIGRLVGVDLDEPDEPLPYLDAFACVDLCIPDDDTFPPGTFDVVVSRFAIEHMGDPAAAFANLGRWLRPGGLFVGSTVNRRHPFVRAYLAAPGPVRRRLQPMIKASAADVHPLVGACNDPATIRRRLAAAGFERIEVATIGNLGHAWGRRIPTFVAGAVGDLLAQRIPSRRSSLIVVARTPVAT